MPRVILFEHSEPLFGQRAISFGRGQAGQMFNALLAGLRRFRCRDGDGRVPFDGQAR